MLFLVKDGDVVFSVTWLTGCIPVIDLFVSMSNMLWSTGTFLVPRDFFFNVCFSITAGTVVRYLSDVVAAI